MLFRSYAPEWCKYVHGTCHNLAYITDFEFDPRPVVDPAGLYDLGDSAWLTLNCYDALILNTRNMLIADVDFGEPGLDGRAGVRDCDEVLDTLGDLRRLDEEHVKSEAFRFADQSYRVYRTHSGCRVICTSTCVSWREMGWAAAHFMRFLGGDPKYIKLCDFMECYRARLTPKPWRVNDAEAHVCSLENTCGEPRVAPELEAQLRLHDELTLPEREGTCLA